MLDIITPKQLAALAKACRKAGITSFKGHGIEFTLSETQPSQRVAKDRKEVAKDLGPNEIESDELSPEALMFWSTGGETNVQEHA